MDHKQFLNARIDKKKIPLPRKFHDLFIKQKIYDRYDQINHTV